MKYLLILLFYLSIPTALLAQTSEQTRLPNIISPNGDGMNDTFYIGEHNIENAPRFLVVNRWGKTVFEAERYINQWDARETLTGTYFYTLTFGDGRQSTGWIQVVN